MTKEPVISSFGFLLLFISIAKNNENLTSFDYEELEAFIIENLNNSLYESIISNFKIVAPNNCILEYRRALASTVKLGVLFINGNTTEVIISNNVPYQIFQNYHEYINLMNMFVKDYISYCLLKRNTSKNISQELSMYDISRGNFDMRMQRLKREKEDNELNF